MLHSIFDTEDEAGFVYRWFLRNRGRILTDNIVFFLHYHVTSAIFLIGCLIVTIGMFLMDPIDCITDKAVDEVIDNYCLYHSTYTTSLGATEQNNGLPAHPGIPIENGKISGKVKYHSYYLWVAMMLALQGVTFYIPRGLWKYFEGSRVDMILKEKDRAFSGKCSKHETQSNDGTVPIGDEKHHEILRIPLGQAPFEGTDDEENILRNKIQRLLNYILSKSHNWYYWNLLVCELLNLINAMAQLLIIDMFLGFGLSRESIDIIQLIQEKRPFERSEVVEQMFPKISTCTFYAYGPSGNIVNYQAVCVLPINAINEKIFGLIFLWLLLLIAVSALVIVYRLVILLPFVRNAMLKVYLRSEEVGKFSLSRLRKRLRIGNWQLLLQLRGNGNIDSWELTQIVKYLCAKCEYLDKANKRM